MTNKGISPLDPSTEVGKLRLLVGDTASTTLSPAELGFADYNAFSDADLEGALLAQGGDARRAAGTLFLQLAAGAAMTGRSIKTDDLAIDTTKRGSDLRAIAQSFFDEATATDSAAAEDFFQIAPFGGRRRRGQCVRPEGTPTPLTCCGQC